MSITNIEIIVMKTEQKKKKGKKNEDRFTYSSDLGLSIISKEKDKKKYLKNKK